jgi:hypothetical protein
MQSSSVRPASSETSTSCICGGGANVVAPRGSQRGARDVAGTVASGGGSMLISPVAARAGDATNQTTARVVIVKNARKSRIRMKRRVVWIWWGPKRKQSRFDAPPK